MRAFVIELSFAIEVKRDYLMSTEKENSVSDEISNVSDKVLDAFVNELASDPEYAEVASRLKDVVFNDKVSEKVLRTALFGEDD